MVGKPCPCQFFLLLLFSSVPLLFAVIPLFKKHHFPSTIACPGKPEETAKPYDSDPRSRYTQLSPLVAVTPDALRSNRGSENCGGGGGGGDGSAEGVNEATPAYGRERRATRGRRRWTHVNFN